MFEWAWKQTDRVRNGEEALYAEFPSYRRLDVHLWSRAKFYPGCFIMLFTRACIIFFWLFAVGIQNYFLTIGQPDISMTPLTGWRRTWQKWMVYHHLQTIMLAWGYYLGLTEHDDDNIDYYGKYLGPDWRKNKFKGKRVSTIISNHIGFLESWAWMCLLPVPCSYVAHAQIKKFPIGDSYLRAA